MSENILAEEEKEMLEKIALLNAYVINYNKLNNTSGGLLEKVDFSNPSSTNNKITSFYEDLKTYNQSEKEIYISKKKESEEDYTLNIENKKYYSNNKIRLFMKLINESEWMKKKWIIE
uniref:Uncharacterized protein n=1 Tax=viral metagenome TaxID=1070528 RepID=A0A6C0ACK0_9ZZZZ